MAVADIFTAITEDRPYRSGMPKERAVSVLNGMAENESISSSICALLEEHYDGVSKVRRDAAESAVERYGKILEPFHAHGTAT